MESLQGILKETWHFYKKTLILVTRGSKIYYAWCFSLLAIIIVGFIFYWKQHEMGLIETNMTDQVSWGLYIANFTYLVGMAAAAILLVIPSYIYQFKPIKEILVLGELFAASSIVMAILFVMVDLGRTDRVWHMIPLIGSMNFPASLLAWDVIVLNGYLIQTTSAAPPSHRREAQTSLRCFSSKIFLRWVTSEGANRGRERTRTAVR